jgi:hypothetical protein
MARGDCTFRQRDLTAAIKAARNAGIENVRVEISRDGKIVVTANTPTKQPADVVERTNSRRRSKKRELQPWPWEKERTE